jgi:hypothetical protein
MRCRFRSSAATGRRPRLRPTLRHVSVEVRPDQVDACVALWGLLGFERVTPPDTMRDRFIWVERAGTHIHLMPLEHPVRMARGHAAVVVDDYDAALERLHEHGFETRPG